MSREGIHFLPHLARRLLGREIDLDAPSPAAEAEIAATIRLPDDARAYFAAWTSDEYASLPLRHRGERLVLVAAPDLVAAQREVSGDPAWSAGWVVVARTAEPEPGAYRERASAGTVWALDGETGAILRLERAQATSVEVVASSLDAFLVDVIIETGEALPPCSPSTASAGPSDELAVHARVDHAADRLAELIGVGPGPSGADERRARLLAATYGLPPAYRRFLARHASPSHDDVDHGPRRVVHEGSPPIGCALGDVHRVLDKDGGWEELPPEWFVFADGESHAWVLDLSACDGGDCPVLRLDHGGGQNAAPDAPSFAAFLAALVDDTAAARARRHQPTSAAGKPAKPDVDERRTPDLVRGPGSRAITVLLAVVVLGVAIALLVWWLRV